MSQVELPFPLIIICGPISSGKGEVSQILSRSFGFERFSFGDILRENLSLSGVLPPYTREQTDDQCLKLQRIYGIQVMAELALDKIRKRGGQVQLQGVVIDGCRFFEEVNYLKKFPSTSLVWIEAPVSIRFERNLKRAREGDIVILDEFMARHHLESRTMQGISQLADKVIINTGSLTDLKQEIVSFVIAKYSL